MNGFGRIVSDVLAAEARDQSLEAARRVQLRGVVETDAHAADAGGVQCLRNLQTKARAVRSRRDMHQKRGIIAVVRPRCCKNRCWNCPQSKRYAFGVETPLVPIHELNPNYFPACPGWLRDSTERPNAAGHSGK